MIRYFGIAAALFVLVGCSSSETISRRHESLSVEKSHFASFGTNKVHYLTAGKSGPVMVFVHGWSCNANFWREQVPAFADKARLILIDLPGHGQSDKPHIDYPMDFFASSVRAVLRQEHIRKAIFIGHSMGVAVICRVYAQAPDEVAALVDVDGPLRTSKLPPDEAEKAIASWQTPDYRELMKEAVKSMFPTPGTEELRDQVMSEMLATPQYVIVGMAKGRWDPSQPAWELESVKVPLLVMNTRNPVYTPEYEAYARALSAQSDYRMFDGVGHFIMLEKPAMFNAVLTDMLREFDLLAR